MSEPYLGEIRYFPYARGAPQGWMVCDGRPLSIAQYEALFYLIGTTYGGDGQSTFALPDLRGRIGIGTGTDAASGVTYVLGRVLGQETVTLLTGQIPPHTHMVQATTNTATAANPASQVFAAGANVYFAPPATPAPVAMANAAVGAAGLGQAHENCAPTLAILPCICVEGIFPSPN